MARRVKASSSRRRKRAEATVSLAVGGATGQRAEQRAAVLAGAKRGTQSSAPLKTAPTAKDAAKKPVPPMRARSKSHSASQQSSSANANPSASGNGGGGGGGGGAGSAGGVGGVGGNPYDAAGSQAGTRGLDSSNETLLARRSLRNSRAAPSQGRGPIARRKSLTPSVVGSPIGGAGCTVAGTGCGACTSPCGSACQ
eukprot:5840223-Pleurochrysis_carterae.AAC.1